MGSLGPPPVPRDVNHGSAITAVSATMFAFSAISTLVRVFVRSKIVKQFGWDDFTISLAMILHIFSFIFELLAVDYGLGRHQDYLTPNQFVNALKWAELDRIFFVIITCLTKISICLFLLRIPEDKRLRRYLQFVMALFTLTNMAWLIVFLAQCSPIQGLWDPYFCGFCWDKKIEVTFDYFQGGFAAVTDFILALTPITFLSRLQTSLRKKALIGTVMAAGLFATGCCLARISLNAVNADKTDPTWVLVPETIWSILELDIALIAANLPPMFPIFGLIHKACISNYDRLLSGRSRSPLNNFRSNETRPQRSQRDNVSKESVVIYQLRELPTGVV